MNNTMTIYYSLFNYKEWTMYIAATEKGLCYVGSQGEPLEELEKWIKKHNPHAMLVENEEKLIPSIDELKEYFDGKRKDFSSSFDLLGTPFQVNVWNTLFQIPFGKTKCYSDIANEINNPKAVRAVGTAIGSNPIAIIIPCHRVLGKNGTLTGYSGGLPVKERLLQLEGIPYKQ
nr:methylated-DNA--[protein]-cysteine S-methyltransferase [Lysinibacillus timonensis]